MYITIAVLAQELTWLKNLLFIKMKCGVAFLCLLALANGLEVTPVQKVVALMEGMLNGISRKPYSSLSPLGFCGCV
jgi:hypothetical protein